MRFEGSSSNLPCSHKRFCEEMPMILVWAKNPISGLNIITNILMMKQRLGNQLESKPFTIELQIKEK